MKQAVLFPAFDELDTSHSQVKTTSFYVTTPPAPPKKKTHNGLLDPHFR